MEEFNITELRFEFEVLNEQLKIKIGELEQIKEKIQVITEKIKEEIKRNGMKINNIFYNFNECLIYKI